jgi:hypothetical protein
MAKNRPTPVIIGVADVKNKSLRPEDALEPMALMLRAIHLAIADTSLSAFFAEDLLSSIDDISAVATWTWPYPDLPALLAAKLGVQPRRKHYSEHGGNQPAKLLDEAARRIARRESKVCVVTGGEALASRAYCPPGHHPALHDTQAEFIPPSTQ